MKLLSIPNKKLLSCSMICSNCRNNEIHVLASHYPPFSRREPIGASDRFSKRYITEGDKVSKSDVQKMHGPLSGIVEALQPERSKQ